ncbi:metallophosphoesterase family protein [Salirhabdus salicampi]|uniref:metallophosphoesterase family protein n=1 Tax=Salirhabdus salicampi TaxID=476102 RepID=UPI0020C22DE5|nr:DNA repair exonuclease [Salirhabdus salicampi]MCP8617586.1 DNA repair exonuclease [Salirhabdus salicampi]
MNFTFIHAADIHLDSPLKGLERYEGAPVDKIRGATRKAFVQLIDTAIERRVDFLVLAGDLYDNDWKDYNTGLFFVHQMSRLEKEGIPVYLIRGNHDAASLITKEIRLPQNVTECSTSQPETFINDNLQVAIHGQGFPTRAVTDNMASQYPEPIQDYFNIGILHTSVTGREGHEHYAPCSLEDLKGKGYDYWALGHIHQRELLHERNPVVLFPGNIQGRHIRETGAKGCTIVHVKDGQVETLTPITLDVLRWERCEVDISNAEVIDDVMELVRTSVEHAYDQSEGRYLAARIELVGATSLHEQLVLEKDHMTNNFRALAMEIGYGDIWIEKVKFLTTSLVHIDEWLEQDSPVSTIFQYMKTVSEDDEFIAELMQEFESLERALPVEVKKQTAKLRSSRQQFVDDYRKEVEDMILHYLTNAGVKE